VAGTTRSEVITVITGDGYGAKIEYDPEIDMFRSEILGRTGGTDFYGEAPKELKAEVKKSPTVFLEVYKEKEIAPRRNCSSKFNLRAPPELHEKLAIVAQAEGRSMNRSSPLHHN
jgi:predicted HicB family RNase H-like nuclease